MATEVKINVCANGAFSLIRNDNGSFTAKMGTDEFGPVARPLTLDEHKQLWNLFGAEALSDELARMKVENQRLETRVAVLDTALSSVRGALRIFREFVNANAKVWAMGAGVCHHPMWGMVSEALGPEVNKQRITSYEWQFIWADNRRKLGEIT